jgi:hypothetical protein
MGAHIHSGAAARILVLAGAVTACSAAGGGDGSSLGSASSEGGTGGDEGLVFGSGADGTFGASGTGAGTIHGAFSDECNADVYTGERLPMDMYIMFDQSLSMSCEVPGGGSRWSAVSMAMEQFVRSPSAAGLGVGIGYFGNVAIGEGQISCEPAVYAIPDAPIAPLPGNAQAIVDSIGRHGPSSTTPTPAALAGALNHAIAWRDQVGRPGVVLLVTDGQPNECGPPGVPVTPQHVAEIAAAGLAGAAMQTYVLGIVSGGLECGWDPNPPTVPDLDLVAQAGGTGAAFIVDASQDVAAQFLARMNEIRTSAQLPCEFLLPTGASGVDIMQVNLSYTPPGGEPQLVLYASDPSICDPVEGGWHYDVPSAPTRIILCPASCGPVQMQIGGLVEVVLGCPRQAIH